MFTAFFTGSLNRQTTESCKNVKLQTKVLKVKKEKIKKIKEVKDVNKNSVLGEKESDNEKVVEQQPASSAEKVGNGVSFID